MIYVWTQKGKAETYKQGCRTLVTDCGAEFGKKNPPYFALAAMGLMRLNAFRRAAKLLLRSRRYFCGRKLHLSPCFRGHISTFP